MAGEDDMDFISPSKGNLTFEETVADICNYIKGLPPASFRIIIGSDSQVRSHTCFVTAVIVHQVGQGARFYYRKKVLQKIKSLRQKIFYEANLSLELAIILTSRLAEEGYGHPEVEIHLDIGYNGPTKELVKEVVGMVTGNGFRVKIKPQAFGASSVADKYTK